MYTCTIALSTSRIYNIKLLNSGFSEIGWFDPADLVVQNPVEFVVEFPPYVFLTILQKKEMAIGLITPRMGVFDLVTTVVPSLFLVDSEDLLSCSH